MIIQLENLDHFQYTKLSQALGGFSSIEPPSNCSEWVNPENWSERSKKLQVVTIIDEHELRSSEFDVDARFNVTLNVIERWLALPKDNMAGPIFARVTIHAAPLLAVLHLVGLFPDYLIGPPNYDEPPRGGMGICAKDRLTTYHSFPKFLGGDPKQPLTKLPDTTHRQLHRDLNKFLRNRRCFWERYGSEKR